ncbi:MAG: hypothetical protein ACKVP2_15375 [Burkholderiales bacterium]
MTLANGIGLFGASLLVAAATTTFAGRWLRGPRVRAATVSLALIACWIPVQGLAVAGYVRGITGDLSMTTLLLLVLHLWSVPIGRAILDSDERTLWFALIALAALFLYPMALGLGDYDPYALGFGSQGLLAALLAVTLVAGWMRRRWIMLGILLSASAWLAGFLESRNLWDYLIDPLLAGFALCSLAHKGWTCLRSRATQSTGAAV